MKISHSWFVERIDYSSASIQQVELVWLGRKRIMKSGPNSELEKNT
jgi:hypothetical protein